MSAIESPWLKLDDLSEREGVGRSTIVARASDRRAHQGNTYFQARPVTPEDDVTKNVRTVYRSVKHETPRPTMGARYEITREPEAEMADRLDGVRCTVRKLEEKIELLQVELIALKGALDDERAAHKETRMELHRARGKG